MNNRLSTSRPGLTVLELMIALAITSMVALTLATVLVAAARGMSSASAARSALQRVHAAHARMRSYTDASLAILDHDPDQGIALWLHDERPGGRVNITELRVFWFDPDNQTIVIERVVFPEAWTEEMIEAADYELAPNAGFFLAMAGKRAAGQTQSATLASGCTPTDFTFNNPTIQESNRLSLIAEFDNVQGGVEPMLLVFALPDHTEPS
jgi:hypothetical protein